MNYLLEHTRIFSRCITAIKIFYALLFCIMYQSINELVDNMYGEISLVPVLSWLGLFLSEPIHFQSVAYLCLPLILPAFFLPQERWARIIAALTALTYFGLYASIGNRQSAASVLIWMALYLIILPNWHAHSDRRIKQKVIFGWWICTGLFLMTYFLSGLWKVAYGMILYPLKGELGAFSPYALADVVAAYTLRINQWPWLAKLILEYPFVGWPGYLFAVFLEVLAPLPLFFPRYYKLMGVLLLEFHILSVYILHIPFHVHVYLVFLLLFFSPFSVAWKRHSLA